MNAPTRSLLGWAVAAMSALTLLPLRGAGPSTAIRSQLVVALEAWRNAQGGLRPGNWANALLDVSATIDGPAVGAPAGSEIFGQVHGVANSRRGSFSDDTGAFNPVSGIMANDHVRVFNLHYTQSAADGRWSVKLGQLAVDDDFMISRYAALFLHSSFGALPSQVATPLCSAHARRNAFPVYSVATPGIWLRAAESSVHAWQFGVYHGAPGSDTETNRGFSWGNFSQGGILVFAESVSHRTLADQPATRRVGVAVHSGKVDNFAAERSGMGETRTRGIYSIYAVQDVVLRADSSHRPTVAAFGRLGLVPEAGRAVVDAYGDSGIHWYHPLRDRGEDIAGLAIAVTRFAQDFAALAAHPRTQSAIEATYRTQVTRTWAVQADLQVLAHPVQDRPSGRRGTAVVLGLRTTAVF